MFELDHPKLMTALATPSDTIQLVQLFTTRQPGLPSEDVRPFETVQPFETDQPEYLKTEQLDQPEQPLMTRQTRLNGLIAATAQSSQGVKMAQPISLYSTASAALDGGSVGYFQTNNLVVSGFSNWFWNDRFWNNNN